MFFFFVKIICLKVNFGNFSFKGFQENLHAIFCLAENAVGPKAVRPDDVITMYSGKYVIVHNLICFLLGKVCT